MDKIKRDCFAWHDELGYCIALKETYCAKDDKCNFYQNAKERCRKCSEKNGFGSCYENIKNRNCIRKA